MGRRAPNEGSVYARKVDGKIVAWVASITVWRDGKRGRRKAERRTKREALEALDMLRQRKDRQATTPLGVYAEAWRTALPHRPGTLASYEQVLRCYVLPHLGANTPLDGVTERDGEAMRDALLKKHTPRVVRLALAVVHSLYTDAIKAGDHPGPNPFQRVTLPRIPRAKVKALTPAQARRFLDAARGTPCELALKLCLSLGLRRGEVCGLRLDAVDLEGGRLAVRGNLTKIVGGLHYGPPKSESGERSLKLTAALAAELEWYIQRRATLYTEMRWADSPYVFYSTVDGTAMRPAYLTDAFTRTAKAAGIEGFTLHSLRHSCASFLHAQRVPLKTISTILGHANTQITQSIYTSIFQDDMDDAVDAVDALIRKRSG